jgi:tetratricopeptide (TPR) repeat protein
MPAEIPRSRLLRGRARWLGRAVLLLLPFVFLGLVEGALRLARVGRPEPLVIRLTSGPAEVYQINPEVGRRYFPPEMERIMPKPGFRLFPVRKEPDRLRLFVLGESSAAGFPYHTNGAFSGFLEDRLGVLLPGRKVEVINCAMTAINSYAVLDYVKELRRYQPDMFILYLGHNEYYGALGPASRASFGLSPGAVRLLRWVMDLRLMRVLRAGLEKLQGPPERVQGKTVMEAMAGRTGIRRGDAIDRTALRGFERNLREIVRAAGPTPVILCEVVSNLRDQTPFQSIHPRPMQRVGQDEYERLLAQGRKAAEKGRADEALALSDRATLLDSTYAEGRYLRARLLDAQGSRPEALRDYRAAREYDAIPFRAPQEINEIIRRVARETASPLVPVEDLFAARARDGIPGQDLFFEHVHPRLAGQQLIASGIAQLLYQGGLLARTDEWHWEADRSPEQYLRMSAVTPLDQEIADQRIFRLTRQWPFPVQADAGYPSSRDPVLVETAQAFLAHRFDLVEAHTRVGRTELERGNLNAALAEYVCACKIFPVAPANYAAAGQILLKLGRTAEAKGFLQQALLLNPSDVSIRRLLEQADRSPGASRSSAD